MGQIMKITCTACKKEWECMTGCGLSHACLQDAAHEFVKEVAADITREAEEEEFPVFDFAFHISKCDGCGSMVSVPVLQMMDCDAEYIGNCPVCGHEVELVTKIDNISCPVCGRVSLAAEESGLWD